MFILIIFSNLELKSYFSSSPLSHLFNSIRLHFMELHPKIRLKSSFKNVESKNSTNFPLFELLIVLFLTLAIINLSGMVYSN